MRNRSRLLSLLLLLTILFWAYRSHLFAQNDKQGHGQPAVAEQVALKPTMIQASTCEKVENLIPVRESIVFSVSAGQVCCFTAFDPVPQAAVVYHRWFHRDQLSTQIKLRLYPPRWTTYSVIQLRETDKGPWRVEIADTNGHIYDVLRLSITD